MDVVSFEVCAVQVRYMSGKRCWQDASASIILLDAFRQGRVMLLMSAHAADIWHLNSFLTSHRFSGLTVSIDESDNVWSSYNPGASEKLKLTVRSQRETGMYRLLGSLLPGSYKPLRKGSRVRSLVQVSLSSTKQCFGQCICCAACSNSMQQQHAATACSNSICIDQQQHCAAQPVISHVHACFTLIKTHKQACVEQVGCLNLSMWS